MLNSLRLSTTRLSASGGPIYATNSTMTSTNFDPEISLSVLKCYSDETVVVGAVDEGVDGPVLHNKLEETICAPLAIWDDSTISIETCDSSVTSVDLDDGDCDVSVVEVKSTGSHLGVFPAGRQISAGSLTSVDLDDDDCDASVVEVKPTGSHLGVFPAGRQISAGSLTSVDLDDDDCDASVVEVKPTGSHLGVFPAGRQMSAGSFTSGDLDTEDYDTSADADLDVAPIGHKLSSGCSLVSAKLDDDECDSSLVSSDDSILSKIPRPKLLAIRTSDELIDNERMKQLLPWEFTHPTDLSGRQGTDFAPGSEMFSIFGASRVSLETYMTRMGELCGGPLGQRLEDVMDGEKEESERPYWGRPVVSPIRPGPQSNTNGVLCMFAGRKVEFTDVCEESFIKSQSCCLPIKNALRKLGRRLRKSSLKKAARQRVLEQLASESFQPMSQIPPAANIAPTSAHITVSNALASETQHLGDDHLCSESASFIEVPDSGEGCSECCSDFEVRLSSECQQGGVDQIGVSPENGEGFTEGCSEVCSESCGEGCSESCGEGCSEGCGEGCCESCGEVCSESCGEGCSESCGEGCSESCGEVCSESCGEGCSESCGEVCSESCDEGCSESCGEGCSESCGEVCSESCDEGCSESCSEGRSDGRVRHTDKIRSFFTAAKRKIQKLKVMFRGKAVA